MVRAWMEGNSSDETVVRINRKFESVPHLFSAAQRAVIHSSFELHYMMHQNWPNLTKHVREGIHLALK